MDRKDIQIKIHLPKLSKDRVDSFWYGHQGKDVATLTLGNRKVDVVVNGEIRVIFEENGESFFDGEATDEAERRNLTDKDFAKISEIDGWLNSNWFEFYILEQPTKEMYEKDLADFEKWKSKLNDWIKYKNSFEDYVKDKLISWCVEGDVVYNYDDAIETAIKILLHDEYWLPTDENA
jgi:hypothetical protein